MSIVPGEVQSLEYMLTAGTLRRVKVLESTFLETSSQAICEVLSQALWHRLADARQKAASGRAYSHYFPANKHTCT